MDNKKPIKLTEAQLRNIITESVKTVLDEISYSTARSAFEKMVAKGQGERAGNLSNTFGEIYNDDDIQYNVANNELSLRRDETPYNFANRMHKFERGDVDMARQGIPGDEERQKTYSKMTDNHHITSSPKLARKYAKATKNYNPDSNLTRDDFRL